MVVEEDKKVRLLMQMGICPRDDSLLVLQHGGLTGGWCMGGTDVHDAWRVHECMAWVAAPGMCRVQPTTLTRPHSHRAMLRGIGGDGKGRCGQAGAGARGVHCPVNPCPKSRHTRDTHTLDAFHTPPTPTPHPGPVFHLLGGRACAASMRACLASGRCHCCHSRCRRTSAWRGWRATKGRCVAGCGIGGALAGL